MFHDTSRRAIWADKRIVCYDKLELSVVVKSFKSIRQAKLSHPYTEIDPYEEMYCIIDYKNYFFNKHSNIS